MLGFLAAGAAAAPSALRLVLVTEDLASAVVAAVLEVGGAMILMILD